MIFLTGSLVMLWFVILSGLTATSPLSQTYFLRADTHGITNSRPISQWTYFSVCGDGNTDCGPKYPALPAGYAWSGNPSGAPAELVGDYGGGTTSFSYWYMWRFGWVFFLIALFFEVVAFFSSFLAPCSRLGSAISGLIALSALVFLTVAVSLMTATFVKMRNAFLADGRDASLGRYAFGFSWGAWAALLISTILFCLGRRSTKEDGAPRRTWGRRRASTRSQKSYEGRRVKEEYP
ncbi:actin cortical patch SUR7/pH-response regulator pali [Lasiosphaeria ovina]|uniref:Actin cortical patch SUR7/pH-response regulator pali n=1 Tax=Lasiosphaeria ovina TaxID=92902 RepID=A0AAE0NL78_9PEZI|nr:actin cortical patch SUR7/pH-response regulator pali [Lasiosphaeria ovina]